MPNTSIGDFDVLLGRGARSNSHVGNIRYRTIVQEYALAYLKSKKFQKTGIAEIVIGRIEIEGGRFLQQESKGSGSWVEVPKSRVITKTLQALRENLDVRNKSFRIKRINPTKSKRIHKQICWKGTVTEIRDEKQLPDATPSLGPQSIPSLALTMELEPDLVDEDFSLDLGDTCEL